MKTKNLQLIWHESTCCEHKGRLSGSYSGLVIIKGVDFHFHLSIYAFSPSIGEPEAFHWDSIHYYYYFNPLLG